MILIIIIKLSKKKITAQIQAIKIANDFYSKGKETFVPRY